MSKIKIITDSACDIPYNEANLYDVDILNIPITIDGIGYYERKDFMFDDFYAMLESAQDIPATSHIPNVQYMQLYLDLFTQGYTDVINITINSKGSNMYQASLQGAEMFFADYPEAKDKFNIHVVDSGTYTYVYGYAVINAAKMAARGRSVDDILSALRVYFKNAGAFVTIFSLEFAKKSGRISGAAAFVGELLGLRPILQLAFGGIGTIDKVRGDRNIPGRLLDYYQKAAKPGKPPYVIIRGYPHEMEAELTELLTKTLGYPPIGVYQLGASISINSGPMLLGVGYLGHEGIFD